MTNAEIYRNWKEAKFPKKQVGIIANMETCKKKEIAEAIIEQCELNGEPIPLYIKHIAEKDTSDDLKELVDSGATLWEIAKEFGVSRTTALNWCQKAGLKTKGHRPANTPKSTPVAEPTKTSEASPILDIATVIVMSAVKIGKGEMIISANPDGTISEIIWRLEVEKNETD